MELFKEDDKIKLKNYCNVRLSGSIHSELNGILFLNIKLDQKYRWTTAIQRSMCANYRWTTTIQRYMCAKLI